MKKRVILFSVIALEVFFAIGSARAQQSLRTGAGVTAVKLSPTFTGALSSLNVELETEPPVISKLKSGVVEFPIVGGVLDLATAKGQIVHTGGLELKAGSTVVTLSDFIIDTSDPAQSRLTGIVTADGSYLGRITLFDLGLTAVSLPLQPIADLVIYLPGVNVILSPEAAADLNKVFKVHAFAAGIPIGTATVICLTSRL
jgi:hypothetical protein